MAASRLASSSLLRVHPNVASALASKKPVVALESTIITHGLPFPANIQTALAIEQAVRDQGAIPATTAFIDGIAHIGLDKGQLQRLAEVGLNATKTSRRDIASVLAAGRGSIGATTVSGTMILAHMAGVGIFGTGGIGGVHRGGENSMDVSADLTELSRTPVAVFCSGAKSILDIPRTLEYLETFGVSTHTFHSSGQFPAFYSARSGYKVPLVSTYRDAARLIHSNLSFNLQSGMIFGVPIPTEFEAAGEKIQAVVEQAVQEAKDSGIDRRGKEVTPWLLKRVGELSQGQSITSNKALVINNVTTAAKVAVELEDIKAMEAERLLEQENKTYFGTGFEAIGDATKVSSKSGKATSSLIVIGYTAIDITSVFDSLTSDSATTWPGQNILSLGGVARNVAESAHHILKGMKNDTVRLVSPVGNDDFGSLVRNGLTRLGMLTDGLIPISGRTASVALQLDPNGDLINGVADIDEEQLGPRQIRQVDAIIDEETRVIVFDGNISQFTMQAILEYSTNVTIFEPTSIVKSVKIIDVEACPDIMTPNEAELLAMHRHAMEKGLLRAVVPTPEEEAKARSLQTSSSVLRAAIDIVKLKNVVLLIKKGSRGVLLARPHQDYKMAIFQRFPALTIDASTIKSTTGCGDTFAGAVAACIHVKLHHSKQEKVTRPKMWSNDIWAAVINLSQKAAILTLQSAKASNSQMNTLSDEIVRAMVDTSTFQD